MDFPIDILSSVSIGGGDVVDINISNGIAVEGLNNIIGVPDGLPGTPSPNQPNERYKAISLQALDKLVDKHPQIEPHLYDIKLAGMVFPFKASPYFVDELIDWDADNVRDDPFYKLVFPTLDMLTPEHREKLELAHAEGDPSKLLQVVADIRSDLNPHPAGQKALNAPKDNDALTGVQTRYERCDD